MDFRIRDNQRQFGTPLGASSASDEQKNEVEGCVSVLGGMGPAAAGQVSCQHEDELASLTMESLTLIEQSLDIVALMDNNGRVVRVNHAIKEITGYLPEEILGRHCAEFVLEEDAESTLNTFSDLLATSHTIKLFENRWQHKDGGIAVLSWSLKWNAQKHCIHATGRDVTERYKARIALQQANERMNSLFERIGDGFCAFDLDWRLTYANTKALSLLKLPSEIPIGEEIKVLAPGLVASSIFASLERAMQQRKAIYFDAFYQHAAAWLEIRGYPSEEGVAVFFRDITRERDMRKAAVEKERRLQEFVQLIPAGYLLVNRIGVIVDVNPALCAMSGYRREELIGQPALLLLRDSVCESALNTVHGVTQIDGEEAVVFHREGHSVHVMVHATLQRDSEGNAHSLNAFLTDISQRKAAIERLEELATHDPLTGLPNRAFLNEQLQVMLDTAPRDENNTVMFVGLDQFREINEALGYDAGDMLLKEMAARFKRVVRPGDVVARLGSAEFVVAASCADGFESAAKIAEKLRAAAFQPLRLSDSSVHISTSIGISMYPHDGRTREQLFRCASAALHKAKAIGGSAYCFFTEEMGAEARIRLALGNDLQHALERGQFRIHYQPRIDLRTGKPVGVEALLRWTHPELGEIPPARFIPIAEAKGLIKPIGHWVMQEACTQAKMLIDKFNCPLNLSVNLSAHQIDPIKLPQQVSAVLSHSGLPPHLLELELTESAIIQDMDASVAVFNQLKEMGIALSIDDFGVGYSSLSYLQHFPIDTLKLDRSFIDQQNGARDGAKFIKALVDLSHTLDMSVVAEGVESEEASRFLQDAGCDEGQGYYFSRPLATVDLECFLRARQQGAT